MISWNFPLKNWPYEVPLNDHPGAFGFKRKYEYHTGVDLYANHYDLVFSVETGHVVEIENFTGPEADSPWWLPTKSILIEGRSGVVCYGEIEPINLSPGDIVLKNTAIAYVVPVLKQGKERKDIKNHSRCMLHLEHYTHNTKESTVWPLKKRKPRNLLDPSLLLKHALYDMRQCPNG